MKSKSNEAKVPALGGLIANARAATNARTSASHGPRTRVTPNDEQDPGTAEAHVGPQPRAPPCDPLRGARTMEQFCADYQFNRVTFWKMRKAGTAPDVILIGRKVLITHAAAAEWEARMIERSRNAVEEEADAA
ncbi:hypothetical protein [Paraburkholderia ferrariae]|uniref:DNA-binding protein n=1 Tax=Paraburkholderia ferrariae TaxID=386056 RepID=A0ABU9RMK2_9BURK